MKMQRKTVNLGKVYFWYLFLVLFLQIIGLDGRSNTLEMVWKIAVIGCTMIYIVNKQSWRVSRQLVFPCILYVAGQLLAYTNYSGARISMFINCAVVIGMAYMFISLPSAGCGFTPEDMLWFVKAFIALMLYAVAYQIVTDPAAVFGALSNGSAYSDMLSSFFDNKQTFGMFLFVAIIVSCMGMAMTKKKSYLVSAGVFFVMLFLCSSRTSLLACVVFILMMLLLFFRSNKNLALAVSSLVLIFILLILVVPSLNRFVSEVLLDTEDTVNAREIIWDASFRSMRGEKIIFGYGEGNASKAIWGVSSDLIGNTHNGLIHVYVTGGLLKLVMYALVVILSLRSTVRIYKHNTALASVFLAAVVSLIVFSMGESLVFLDTSSPCVVASIVGVAFPIAVDGYFTAAISEKSADTSASGGSDDGR